MYKFQLWSLRRDRVVLGPLRVLDVFVVLVVLLWCIVLQSFPYLLSFCVVVICTYQCVSWMSPIVPWHSRAKMMQKARTRRKDERHLGRIVSCGKKTVCARSSSACCLSLKALGWWRLHAKRKEKPKTPGADRANGRFRAERSARSNGTPGLHNQISAQKIFARGWVAQEPICSQVVAKIFQGLGPKRRESSNGDQGQAFAAGNLVRRRRQS